MERVRLRSMNTTTTTAIAYLRVSTDEQAASGLGLEAQRAAIEAWAQRNGATVAAYLSDDGVSGAAGLDKRPGLASALAELDNGAVLVVAKRDRLGRDPILCAMVERSAARVGARVVSAAGEGTDDDGPASVLMRRMVDAFAEYERLLIGQRTKAALAAKKARGERVGGLPYGYALAEDGATLVENGPEQAVLAEARALRAAGLSLRGVAAELARRGFVSRTGGVFAATQIQRMVAA
jgi:DNA invertase Pin-like site-specific DNA recombinase